MGIGRKVEVVGIRESDWGWLFRLGMSWGWVGVGIEGGVVGGVEGGN